MNAPRQPQPYPFDRLRRVARARLPWLRRVGRALGSARPISEEAAALLGASFEVIPAPLEHCPPGAVGDALSDPLVAVVLTHLDAGLGRNAALELDPQLAARIIDRALGGDGGADVGTIVAPLSASDRGALAYVAARLVAGSGLPFVVRGVVTAPAALAGVLGRDGAAVLPARVVLGDDVGLARLWIPEDALSAVQLAPRARSNMALSRVPLSVVIDAAWGLIETADLADIRVGDAVLLDASWLAPRGDGFVGDVRGRIAGASRMELRCALEGDAVVVRAIDVDESRGATVGKKLETKMETDTKRIATDRAADAPVEVTVEIARFTMPLAEIAALSPGEVLATGRAIGERVTLRANGAAVASGELVDVDGEVGVRVLSIAD